MRPSASVKRAPAAAAARVGLCGPGVVTGSRVCGLLGDLHPTGEAGELVAWRASAAAYPRADEVAAGGVVADLLGRELLGVEQRGHGVVGAVPRVVCAGGLDGVPCTALGREAGRVDSRGKGDGHLYVAEFECGLHTVDGDVGRAEGGPEVVGVLADAAGCGVGFGEEGLRCGSVVAAGCGDGSGEEQGSVHRQVGRGRLAEAGFEEVGGVFDQADRVVVAAGGEQRVRERAKQGTEYDGVAGVLGEVEAAFGGDPREVGLAELRQQGRGGLVGEGERLAGLVAVVAGGAAYRGLRVGQDGRQAVDDVPELRLLVGGPQVIDAGLQHW